MKNALLNIVLRHSGFLCFLLITSHTLTAQNTYVPLGGLSNHILDRLEIKSGELANDYFHSALKCYRRPAIAQYVDSFDVGKTALSERDYFDLAYLQNDNFEWSNGQGTRSKKRWGQNFYKEKAAFFSVKHKDYTIVLNPVLYYQRSTDKSYGQSALLSNRGFEIRGTLGKFGFYTQMSDEILQPNSWVQRRFEYDSSLLYVGQIYTYENAYNYFSASGYLTATFNQYMDLKFGHYRNFIGDGYRSMILSDQNPEYLTMRMNTRFWRINYTNIWAELRDYPPLNLENSVQPRHYMATHHLSMNLSKRFNFGLFETILFNRDSGYVNSGFDLNYLNPIIFYKSVENGLNSNDKAILGMNAKYNFHRHFSAYCQGLIAEFTIKEILAGKGYWANKFGGQLGLKYIDAFNISNLDLQVEGNFARPFMYTAFNTKETFSEFHQPLAHPLGANFAELIGIVRYQPKNRLFITAKLIVFKQGLDTNGSNWGSNIMLSYLTKTSQTYNNFIGQGVLTHTVNGELLISWMAKHNLFLDLRIGYRKTSSAVQWFEAQTSYCSFAIRANISQRFYDY